MKNLAEVAWCGADEGGVALVAVDDGVPDLCITRGDLRATIAAVVKAIDRLGLEARSRIGLVADNHYAHACAQLGILASGHVACPVSALIGRERIARSLELAGVRIALAGDEHYDLLPAGVRGLRLRDVVPTPARGNAAHAFRPVDVSADDLAFIMFTSGSTGAPKAVPITHAGYLWAIRSYDFDRPRAAGSRSIVAAPLCHMNAQGTLLCNLFLEATTVLMRRFEPRSFRDAIDRCEVNEITGVPSMLAAVANVAAVHFDGSMVNNVALGSAPMSHALEDQIRAMFPHAAVSNGYGTTESGFTSFGPHPARLPMPRGSLGYPLPDVETRLVGGLDEHTGVLHMRTPMTATGYLDDAKRTAEKFRDGWFITGDVMRRDAAGWFYFIERADDMFVCSGHNVHPAEVEQVIEACGGVRQVAVVPLPDEIRGQVPVAFIVAQGIAGLTESIVQRHCRETGPAFAYPRHVAFVDALPMAATSKIDRTALMREAVVRWQALRRR